MEQQAILRQMQEVFDKVFLTKVELTPDLTAEDVEEWDSLTHLTLLVALEKSFAIRFKTGEVENTKNVGEFAELIRRRLETK